jgi:hypothetical protein
MHTCYQKLLLLCLLSAFCSSCAVTQPRRVLSREQTSELFSANAVVLRTEVLTSRYHGQRYFFNLFPIMDKVDSPFLHQLKLRVLRVEKGNIGDEMITI